MILFTIQLGSLIHLFIQKLTSRRRQQQQLTQKRARIKIANDVVKFFSRLVILELMLIYDFHGWEPQPRGFFYHSLFSHFFYSHILHLY